MQLKMPPEQDSTQDGPVFQMDDANERSLLDSDEHPMNPETRNASTFLKANAAANAVGVIYHDNSEKHVWELEDDAELGDGKMSDWADKIHSQPVVPGKAKYCLSRHDRYKSQKRFILPVAEDYSRCDIP